MKPFEYFKDIVEPTIEESEQNPKDIRRAYLACIVTYHFADAVSVYKKWTKTQVRKGIASISDTFWVIEGVANMAKHIELFHDLKIKPKPEDTNIGASALDGGGYFDRTLSHASDHFCYLLF